MDLEGGGEEETSENETMTINKRRDGMGVTICLYIHTHVECNILIIILLLLLPLSLYILRVPCSNCSNTTGTGSTWVVCAQPHPTKCRSAAAAADTICRVNASTTTPSAKYPIAAPPLFWPLILLLPPGLARCRTRTYRRSALTWTHSLATAAHTRTTNL